MENFTKGFYVLVLVFLVMGFVYNILNHNLPKFPGDINIDRPGIRIYIPFTSALIISVGLLIFLNYLQ